MYMCFNHHINQNINPLNVKGKELIPIKNPNREVICTDKFYEHSELSSLV